MAFQGDSIYWVEVEKIVPNPYQPRREFDEGKLQELAESVRMYGVLQPLTVTRKEVSREDGTFYTEYELIAGERRLRASRLAKLAQVPVIIRTGEQSDQEKLELAIIENLQREDLNAVDRAIAFKQLAEQFSLSHAQVAKKVGRSREYVSNSLRLLQLPEYMLTSLKTGDISEGHGRTLLMLNDRPEEQDTVFREILLKKLSVREVERIARKIATDKVRKKDWGIDPVLMEIEKKFTDTLGTRVQIQKTDYGGKLMIDYFTDDDLNKILDMINAGDFKTVPVIEEPTMAALEESTALSFTAEEPMQEESVFSGAPQEVQSVAPSYNAFEHHSYTPIPPAVPQDESRAESVTILREDTTEESVTIGQGQNQNLGMRSFITSEPVRQPAPEQRSFAAYTPHENVPAENPQPVQAPQPKSVSQEDDTDLYNMRNFGI